MSEKETYDDPLPSYTPKEYIMKSSTFTVERTPTSSLLRAFVLPCFDKLKWRHHGIGVLQAYVRENTNPEIRLHVWHPELVKPGIRESGGIHDHRFDMVSHVIAGKLIHQECLAEEDRNGSFAMMQLTHARAASDNNYHGPTMELPGRFRVSHLTYTFHEGESYGFTARGFHQTISDGLSVSVVEKRGQSSIPARILYPSYIPPVMAFGHEMDKRVTYRILDEAYEALRALDANVPTD